MGTSAVLLAAGASVRFGAPKMLADAGGEPLLARTVRVFAEAGTDEIVVVLGAGAEGIRTALGPSSARFVTNERWLEGMLTSVQAGLAAVSGEWSAVTPADFPFLLAASVRRLLDVARSARPDQLVVPLSDGRRGHPLVLSSAVAARIQAWPPSRRLSDLMSEPDISVLEVPGFDDDVLRDADVPADLVRGTT